SLETTNGARNQWRQNVARLLPTKTAVHQHLQGYIKQRHDVAGDHDCSSVIERFIFRTDRKALATKVAHNLFSNSQRRPITFDTPERSCECGISIAYGNQRVDRTSMPSTFS